MRPAAQVQPVCWGAGVGASRCESGLPPSRNRPVGERVIGVLSVSRMSGRAVRGRADPIRTQGTGLPWGAGQRRKVSTEAGDQSWVMAARCPLLEGPPARSTTMSTEGVGTVSGRRPERMY